jgi:hypothetical protein
LGYDEGGVHFAGLAKMNPDGSERHFITSNPEEGHHPDWESVRSSGA